MSAHAAFVLLMGSWARKGEAVQGGAAGWPSKGLLAQPRRASSSMVSGRFCQGDCCM